MFGKAKKTKVPKEKKIKKEEVENVKAKPVEKVAKKKGKIDLDTFEGHRRTYSVRKAFVGKRGGSRAGRQNAWAAIPAKKSVFTLGDIARKAASMEPSIPLMKVRIYVNWFTDQKFLKEIV